MLNITANSFTSGEYTIAQSTKTTTDLTAAIAKYEKRYLLKLFGAEMYDLFEDDLSGGVPQSAEYLAIYNPFYENDGKILYQSEGMLEMLKNFIFFEFLRKQPLKSTVSGIEQNEVENGTIQRSYKSGIIAKYNAGVETYKAIQWKLCENTSLYPDYIGQNIDKIFY